MGTVKEERRRRSEGRLKREGGGGHICTMMAHTHTERAGGLDGVGCAE